MRNGAFQPDVSPWLDAERTIPFLKGRVALHAILRGLGIGKGDEVLVPGFTCVVVPASVTYCGAAAKFYDVGKRGINGDPEKALALIGKRTKAVLIQHTFGYPCDAEPILQECLDRGIPVIEDCAHALGSTWKGKPVGTLGEAAFCSFQWSKPVTTGLGGMARINNSILLDRVRDAVRSDYKDPGPFYSAQLEVLLATHRLMFGPKLYWTAMGTYRFMSRLGVLPGSSSPSELVSPTMPDGYKRTFGSLRTRTLARVRGNLYEAANRRITMAALIEDRLEDLGIPRPSTVPATAAVPLRIPVLVRDKSRILADARAERIELGDWFDHPLHPRTARCQCFGYTDNLCPDAEWMSDHLVNIPTHSRIDAGEVDMIMEFFAKRIEQIMP